MYRRQIARVAGASLLGSVSLLSIATSAHASSVVFTSSSAVPKGELAAGREVAVQGGIVQVKLDNGAMASFADSAQFSLRADGGVDLRSGSVTIVAGSGGTAAVHMPDGVSGTVATGGTATFTANASGAQGSATAGSVSITANGATKSFTAGQFWNAGAGRSPDRVIAGSAAAVPGTTRTEAGPVQPMREGGVVAAAENGIPVALGEALAAVGAKGDVVAAARRIEAYDANPSVARFPTGDYTLLVEYAAQAAAPLGGGTAFNGAGADIVRTYFQYLAGGNPGANFRTAYAAILLNYLDLVRAGVLPSTFRGATQAQLNAYLAFIGRTEGFGTLSVANKQLLDAYLAFLSTGGTPDAFGTSVTNLTTAFLNYVRAGGQPAAFTQASASVVAQYLAIVNSGGLKTNLTAQNQALLTAYLTSNGIGFIQTDATALAAFAAYLNTGGLPSAYTVLPAATIRSYLETLETTGLFDSVLGSQAVFLRSYLVFLRGGGTADQFNALPINIARVNAAALNVYVDYLLAGGAPTAYTVLTQAQVRAALDQLTATGQFNTLLGQNAAFLTEYYAYIRTGADADTFAGLPSVDVQAYANALGLFAAYLRAGNLPSSYTVLTAQQIRSYLTALQVSNRTGLLGANADLLNAYATYIRGGGTPDQFAGLPIVTYTSYATALNAYFTYLNAGGLPSSYTALTQAQVRQYLDVLAANNQITALLGANAAFYASYQTYLAGGGAVDAFGGLPIVVYQGYASALTTYYAYLNAGGLPSRYTALTQAQIRQYLDVLRANNQLTALLGSNATFFSNYLTYLAGGGSVDAFAGLPIVTYQGYATALNAYYAFLLGGGSPSAYAALTQAQIRAYLDALQAAGQVNALLGSNAAFFTNYLAYLVTGGNANAYPGLPSNTYGQYAAALNAYFAYLNSGGLPSGYTALTQAQIRQYLDVLQANNQFAALLGSNATFFTSYLTYLAGGGTADQFTGLPIVTYQNYASALNAYYAFLVGGGTPSAYTALTQAQIRAYLDALQSAGQVTALLGSNASFFANYLTYLASGGSANAYPGLPSATYGQYASALNAYFAYLNAGGLPSGYTALTQAQIRQYLDVLQANNQFAALLGSNATFFSSYLTYLAGGGSADAFTGLPIVTYQNYASALNAYYAFLAGGGTPSAYTALTQAQIRAYLDALQAAGQVNALLGANASFFANYLTYLAGGGNPNAYSGLPSATYGQYASALNAYFAYLNAGGLPSGYTALTQAQIRQYLDVLQANNQFAALLGSNAAFFTTYLTYLAGGGTADAFTGLPIVTYRNYATALNAYYVFLAGGGLPANYTALTQAQIRAYLDALQSAGQVNALLGANATFFSNYLAYLAGGGSANSYPGLPATTYAQYGTAITQFVAYLRGNGLPASYTALTATQLRDYLAVLTANGQLSLIGNAADIALVQAYATYLASGGVPNQFQGLPAFVTYEAALRTYYAYLQGGGKPSAYTALTQTQIVAYIQALDAAGLVAARLSADEAKFLRDYAAYVGAGNNADQFAGLPGNQPVVIPVPVVTQGLANAPRSTATTKVALTAAGHTVFSPATTAGSITLSGNSVVSTDTVTGGTVTVGTAKTLEARTVDSTIALARIGDGTYQTGGSTYTANVNQGVHFVWGTPATALPTATGILTYGLVSATSPTADPNATVAAGTFTGNFALDTANRRVGWDNVVQIGTQTYVMKSTGGLTAPSVALSSTYTFTTSSQPVTGASTTVISGFLAGASGAYAGFSYQLQNTIYNQVSGVAIFGQGAPAVALPSTGPTASLPAPTYAYAAGLATTNLTVRSTYPGAAGSAVTFQNGAGVTRDTNGALTTSSNASTQDLTRLTAKTTDIFGDTRAAIGRWYDGTYRVGPTNNAAGTLSATQSLHYVQLAPTSFTVPTTGQVNYTLLAATQPTYNTGATGAGLFDGKMALVFGSAVKVALEGTIRMPETSGTVTYAFATAGGVAGVNALTAQTISGNVIAVTAPLTGSGLACTTACVLNFSGGFAGADVNRLGGVYFTSDSRSTAAPSIEGAAIFTGAAAPVVVPAQPTYAYRGGFGTTANARARLDSDPNFTQTTIDGSTLSFPVTAAADGSVSSFGSAATGIYARNAASNVDVAGDSAVLIGRWTNGSTTIAGSTRTLGLNDGFHYILVTPATRSLPTTGTVQYTLIGATQPTMFNADVRPGVLDARLAITYGTTQRVGVDGALYFTEPTGGVKYSFATTGGVDTVSGTFTSAPTTTGFAFQAPLTGTGVACAVGNNCTINFVGSYGGSDTNRIGVIYSTNGSSASINGAAAFGAVGTQPGTATSVAGQSVLAFINGAILETATNSTVTYESGAPKSYTTSSATRVGTPAADSGSLANTIGWARWTGDTAGSATNQGPNQGLHVLTGTPTSNTSTLPTGTVQYTLVGGTKPTLSTGASAPGTLTGTLAVQFGSIPKVGFDLNVSVGQYAWNVATTGGSASPAQSQVSYGSALSFGASLQKGAGVTGANAASCTGTCSANVNGQMFGTGVPYVGLGVGIFDGTTGATAVAVFGKAAP